MSNIKDITFKIENNKFNYRVCAIIINDNKILALKDERSPYYYLPGGRVQIGETAKKLYFVKLKKSWKLMQKLLDLYG